MLHEQATKSEERGLNPFSPASTGPLLLTPSRISFHRIPDKSRNRNSGVVSKIETLL